MSIRQLYRQQGMDFSDDSRNKQIVFTNTASACRMVGLPENCRGQRFHLYVNRVV
jgi:hypothetical protein